MFSRKTISGIGLGIGLFASACGPTRTELLGTATVTPRPAVFKMVVVGVSMREDERTVVEDELVAHLRTRGIDAHPSYEVYAGLSDVTGHDALLAAGYEAVLRVQVQRIERVIMSDDEHDFVWTKINIGTSLWDTASDHLVWTAETRTKDPIDERDLAHSLAGVLLPELTNARLVRPVRGSGA